MADSAPKVAAKERREAASAIDKKAATLVKQINESKHFIAFTGAGISTSAGMSLACKLNPQNSHLGPQESLIFGAPMATGRAGPKAGRVPSTPTRSRPSPRRRIWPWWSCKTGES